MWKKTGTLEGSTRSHREHMQISHRQHQWTGLNLGIWNCEAAVLLAVPRCRPDVKGIIIAVNASFARLKRMIQIMKENEA